MADPKDMAAAYEAALKSGDLAKMTALAHEYGSDDFVQEWPQSGERLTKESSIKLLNSYPEMTGTKPAFTYKRMLGAGDHFVIEGTIDYGDGIPVNYIGIGDLRDGKVTKMTEYFANPFEAPAWRAGFVEHMEPAAV
jgi:ketosteroid isomerase-like protein